MVYLLIKERPVLDGELQLASIVNSCDFGAVLAETLRIYQLHYPESGAQALRERYRHAEALYAGSLPGYRNCLVEYHDFRHTMDVTLATARLIDGYNLTSPPLEVELASGLLLAALLHDAGYIQEEWDTEGTGAKYTREHERRSVEFVRKNAGVFGIEAGALPGLARMIQATDLKLDFADIPYASAHERTAGAILGSADLLGQMADREYLEKLLFLYYEFREAGIPGHNTEFDILRKTRGFYESTRQRLRRTLLGVHGVARLHFRERFGDDRDLYEVAIERQMAYLDAIIADSSTNFRHKLHRGDQKRLHERRAPAA
jgi:hypothetical protein